LSTYFYEWLVLLEKVHAQFVKYSMLFTVESGYNDFQGTEDFTSLYPADALAEKSKKKFFCLFYGCHVCNRF